MENTPITRKRPVAAAIALIVGTLLYFLSSILGTTIYSIFLPIPVVLLVVYMLAVYPKNNANVLFPISFTLMALIFPLSIVRIRFIPLRIPLLCLILIGWIINVVAAFMGFNKKGFTAVFYTTIGLHLVWTIYASINTITEEIRLSKILNLGVSPTVITETIIQFFAQLFLSVGLILFIKTCRFRKIGNAPKVFARSKTACFTRAASSGRDQ